MRVWLVEEGYDYDKDDLRCVCATEELALREVKRLVKEKQAMYKKISIDASYEKTTQLSTEGHNIHYFHSNNVSGRFVVGSMEVVEK